MEYNQYLHTLLYWYNATVATLIICNFLASFSKITTFRHAWITSMQTCMPLKSCDNKITSFTRINTLTFGNISFSVRSKVNMTIIVMPDIIWTSHEFTFATPHLLNLGLCASRPQVIIICLFCSDYCTYRISGNFRQEKIVTYFAYMCCWRNFF